MQSRQVSNFKINKMTKAQYSGIVPSQDEVYITTDEADAVLSVNGILPNSSGNVLISIPTESTVSGWGFTKNVGTVTSVNGILPNAQGNVTLNIPSAVTESTVSGWGFTKNVGTVTSVNGNTPDGSGNVAITIPTVPTNVSAFTNDAGYITSSAISNLADTTLSNLSTTASPNFDGQWIPKYLQITTAATAGSRTHDLSTYLPTNDDYLVLMKVYVTYSSATAALGIGSIASPYTNATSDQFFAQATVSTNSRISDLSIVMPVSNRTLYTEVSAALGSVNVVAYGYRRLGTNT